MDEIFNITEWLKELGLEVYGKNFVENHIEKDVLLELSDADIKEIGIYSLGHRKQILQAIVDLKRGIPISQAQCNKQLSQCPSIIAIPIQHFLNESHPTIRLWYGCDLVELLLRLTVLVGVNSLFQKKMLSIELLRELQPRIEEPTLGKWRGMAQATVKAMGKEPCLIPEMITLVNNVLVPLLDGDDTRKQSPSSSFSHLRNLLAHGAGVTQSTAKRLAEIWVPKLNHVISDLSWLDNLSFVVVQPSSSDLVVMKGTQHSPVPFVPEDGTVEPLVRNIIGQGKNIVLVRGKTVIPLYPLTIYGVPKNIDPDAPPASEPAIQIYARRGEVSLFFTPIDTDEVAQSESDENALTGFLDFFRFDELEANRAKLGYEVRGFEDDIHKDAERLVGRVDELSSIRNTLLATQTGTLWVTGTAGIGKSYLMARIATELLDEPPEQALVLAYRFKAGDDRCSRSRFLRFAIERIENWNGLDPRIVDEKEITCPDGTTLIDKLRKLFERSTTRRIILILDGLDEIAETDSTFAEQIPLGLRYINVSWLCSGRPERGLPELFTPERSIHVFPHGVPDMTAGDIRTMLLEKIGPLRRQLLQNDREEGNEVINPFINKVHRCAGGLPIYVKYLIGDILNNKFRALDAGERLPESLERYHEELLKRCCVGTLHQVVTPLASTLAAAKEALSIDVLADLLIKRNVLSDDEDVHIIVRKALSAIASMLRRVSTPEGSEGYTLFHHSLRQHMEQSPEIKGAIATARKSICKLALAPEAGSPSSFYLYRSGISHLIETSRYDEAKGLLCNFDYLMDRLAKLPGRGGVRGVTEDWDRIKAIGCEPDDKSIVWEEFWRANEHLIRYGDEQWETQNILLQLAWGYATTSCITQAAESWLRDGRCKWSWLQLSNQDRPAEILLSSCSCVLEGNRSCINTCALTVDRKHAIAGTVARNGSSSLLIWDVETKECIKALPAHAGALQSLVISNDGRYAYSGGEDNIIRVWDMASQECIKLLHGHSGEVRALALCVNDNKLLSTDSKGGIFLWTITGTEYQRIQFATVEPSNEINADKLLNSGETGVYSRRPGLVDAVACDKAWKTAITGGLDRNVRVWDIEHRRCKFTLEGHSRPILTVAITPDSARAVSGGIDGCICLWDLKTGVLLNLWGNVRDAIAAAAISADGKQVFTGCREGPTNIDVLDRSIQVWNPDTGLCVKRLYGHADRVLCIRLSADESQVISGGSEGSVRVWDLKVQTSRLRKGSELLYVNSVVPSLDGKSGLTASDDATIRLWDLQTRKQTFAMHGHIRVCWNADFSPDKSLVASVCEDSTLRVWSLKTGTALRVYKPHPGFIYTMTLTPDGTHSVIAGGVETDPVEYFNIRYWSFITGNCEINLRGHTNTVHHTCITPDGRIIVSYSSDRTLRSWQTSTGDQIRLMQNPDAVSADCASAGGVAVSRDGKSLFCGTESGEISVWNLTTGTLVSKLVGHTGRIRRMVASPDNRCLLTGGDDCSLRLWDLTSNKLIAVAFFEAWVTCVSFVDANYKCWIGLSNGKTHMIDLVNYKRAGAPLVTAAKIWHFGPSGDSGLEAGIGGKWAGNITYGCPWCGDRFSIGRSTMECIKEITSGLQPDSLPCLDLPAEAWAESPLQSSCGECGNPLKFNPFVVDNSDNSC